jgi:hypothetical protein
VFFLLDTSNPGDEMVDLGYLYDFIQELKSLCVSGVASRSSPCQELISNQAFDISLFKSLQKLQVRLLIRLACFSCVPYMQWLKCLCDNFYYY